MFQGIYDYFFESKDNDKANLVGGISNRSKEKHAIAQKLKNISEEEAIKDFARLKQIDLKKVSNETRTGNKFVDYFTFCAIYG